MIASRGIVRVFVGVVAILVCAGWMHALTDRWAAVESLHGRIVTDAFIEDSSQIFTMNADGSHRVQLTQSCQQRRSGVVAGRSKLIAFDSDRVRTRRTSS